MEHHFTPTRYHTTLGPHPPVLRVGDGDTLVTTTVDAWGIDHRREQVTPRSNPQTGPFYVEGAESGDTLAVDLEEIRPNRAYGFCYSAVAPNVVDPDYVRQLPPSLVAEWEVDAEKGTATLVGPESKLGRLVIPLEPMLGCFGVAAKGGQAISTATSAEHGGNMDYRGFVAGATVYFPVFEPGALFFLGDGHAVQGDGEIVGTGIEISMDVRLTLRVLKGQVHRVAAGRERRVDLHRRERPAAGSGHPARHHRDAPLAAAGLWPGWPGRQSALVPVCPLRPRKHLRPGLYHGLQGEQGVVERSVNGSEVALDHPHFP